ncbi:MAG TPA: hypothetical protein VFB13_02060 [Reyranella sp.]|jgi:hypothetical protein|nr:hypothetical protein [Reyranella sp.]
MDDLADATGAEALQNDFLRGRAATLDDGLFQLEGGDAVAAAPGAARQLAGLRDQLLQRAGSAGQRAMLADDLDAHMDVAQDAIARHVARQAKVWDEAVRADRIGLLNDQARRDWDDPGKLALYGDAAASASAGDDAATARSGVWRSAIDQALTQGQHGAAIDLHANAQDHLTPEDADALAPEIAIARQMQTGRAYVDGLVQRLPDTLQAIGPAHADALSRNTVDWPDDAEQQATNRHLIDVLFGSRQRALQQAAGQRDQAVQDWLTRRDGQGNPQTERPPPSLWKQLDRDQRQQVDAQLAQNARGEVASDSAPDEAFHRDGAEVAQADNIVTPRGFTYEQVPPELDPHKLNRPITREEQQEIANTLNKFLTGQFDGLNLHSYKNYPHNETGAALPPSKTGYVVIDVPNAALDRGGTRIVINRDTHQVYYTNILHYVMLARRLPGCVHGRHKHQEGRGDRLPDDCGIGISGPCCRRSTQHDQAGGLSHPDRGDRGRSHAA